MVLLLFDALFDNVDCCIRCSTIWRSGHIVGERPKDFEWTGRRGIPLVTDETTLDRFGEESRFPVDRCDGSVVPARRQPQELGEIENGRLKVLGVVNNHHASTSLEGVLREEYVVGRSIVVVPSSHLAADDISYFFIVVSFHILIGKSHPSVGFIFARSREDK